MTTAQRTQQSNAPAHGGRQAADSAPGILGGLLRLLYWLVLALLFSIFVEWIGMVFWWPEEGVNHSLDMLRNELGYLSGDLRKTLLVSDTAAYATAFAEAIYHWLWQKTGLEAAILWLAAPPPPGASSWHTSAHTLYSTIAQFVSAAANITQVFAVRLAVLSLAMPAFVLAMLLGVLDGLVMRDLRRWGGGRESAFLYHHTKRWIWPLFIAVWVFYLSLPISIHPAFSILPFAALIGLIVTVTVSTFKKYL